MKMTFSGESRMLISQGVNSETFAGTIQMIHMKIIAWRKQVTQDIELYVI